MLSVLLLHRNPNENVVQRSLRVVLLLKNDQSLRVQSLRVELRSPVPAIVSLSVQSLRVLMSLTATKLKNIRCYSET